MDQDIPPLVEVIEFLSELERGERGEVTVELLTEQLAKLEAAKMLVKKIPEVHRRLGLDSVIERLENRILIITDGLTLVTHSKEFNMDQDTERLLESMAPSDREWYLQQKAKGMSDEEIVEMLLGKFLEEE